jgi:aerobic carbon-monoxide dehydrogenase small subunit
MNVIALTVNEKRIEAQVQPRTQLADFLREQLRLTGTHLGCEHGVCGACTVLVDGIPVRSCIVLAVACEGREVRSIEGFEQDALMNELREAFRREHGLQCGYCTPGMLIAARDVVERVPDADEARIRRELAGNLCRCTGYIGIINAVRSVIASRRERGIAAVTPQPWPKVAAKREKPATGIPHPSVATGSPQAAAASPLGAARETQPNQRTTAPAPPAAASIGGAAHAGWTRFSESFLIAHPAATVWRVLCDFPLVAACLPGAELLEFGDRHVKGRMTVKLGPIRAAFVGSATVELDDDAKSGKIRGGGSDSGSGSRTKADATYQVTPEPSGASRVDLTVEYNLQGPLAQFSRSGLAQDLGRRLVAEFAANLNNRLSTSAPAGAAAPPKPLAAGSLFWGALRERFRRLSAKLFGRGG